MNIGFDLGNTIVGNRQLKDKYYVDPNCFNVIKNLVNLGHEIFIVSRVNEQQRERSLKWLNDIDFFNKTGVKKDNLYYCWERRDKSIFTRALNINIFVDDRIECLINMDKSVVKIAINPPDTDLLWPEEELKDFIFVKNWQEIENKLKLLI